jgi:methionyl aminopeptidase
MISDSAFSIIVGQADPADEQLLATTQKSLQAGIDQVKASAPIGNIGAAVQSVLDKGGYGVVRDLVGHGVGRSLHEAPEIPNFGTRGSGRKLLAGMTIAIEPMATRGSWKVDVLSDNWTIVARDGSRSAHFEHTVLITDNGVEVLTARN